MLGTGQACKTDVVPSVIFADSIHTPGECKSEDQYLLTDRAGFLQPTPRCLLSHSLRGLSQGLQRDGILTHPG